MIDNACVKHFSKDFSTQNRNETQKYVIYCGRFPDVCDESASRSFDTFEGSFITDFIYKLCEGCHSLKLSLFITISSQYDFIILSIDVIKQLLMQVLKVSDRVIIEMVCGDSWILQHIPNTPFVADSMTFNDGACPIYNTSCGRCGLLSDDQKCKRALQGELERVF